MPAKFFDCRVAGGVNCVTVRATGPEHAARCFASHHDATIEALSENLQVEVKSESGVVSHWTVTGVNEPVYHAVQEFPAENGGS